MDDFAAQAAVFKAFCNETRLQVLSMLRDGEMCSCRIVERVDCSPATLSHHMRILVDSGVVIGRRDGKYTHYAISPRGAEAAKALLSEVLETR